MRIYDKFPTFENDELLLRPVGKEDCTDLLAVYSDKNALPFFNSDNCDGDNFYYPTIERMNDALLMSFLNVKRSLRKLPFMRLKESAHFKSWDFRSLSIS